MARYVRGWIYLAISHYGLESREIWRVNLESLCGDAVVSPTPGKCPQATPTPPPCFWEQVTVADGNTIALEQVPDFNVTQIGETRGEHELYFLFGGRSSCYGPFGFAGPTAPLSPVGRVRLGVASLESLAGAALQRGYPGLANLDKAELDSLYLPWPLVADMTLWRPSEKDAVVIGQLLKWLRFLQIAKNSLRFEQGVFR